MDEAGMIVASLVLRDPCSLKSRMAFRWAAYRAAERLGWVDRLRFRVSRWDAYSPDCEAEFDRLRTIGVLDYTPSQGQDYTLTAAGMRFLVTLKMPHALLEGALA